MLIDTLKRIRFRVTLGVMLLISLLAVLLMTSDALNNSQRFEHLYSSLLMLSTVGLIALGVLIGLNLRHLLLQIRRRRAGARLTFRLVGAFILLAILPVLIVYYFSLDFLHQRLDNWFDVAIEEALNDALLLSDAALDTLRRNALRETEQISAQLAGLDNDNLPLHLPNFLEHSDALELTVFESSGRIVAFSGTETVQLLPQQPEEQLLLQLKYQPRYIGLEPGPDNTLRIRVVLILQELIGNEEAASARKPRYLHALFPVQARISRLAEQVDTAVNRYQQLEYLRKPLNVSFTLVLSLVALLSVFSAIWAAFFSARRLVAPIRDLEEGTRAVANGDYDKQLPVKESDELNFLVHSFNDMTRKIAIARDQARHSQTVVDTQRAYLQAILGRMSSGVLSLNLARCLRTSNPAAEHILGLPLTQLAGQDFVRLCENNPTLTPLCETLEPYLHSAQQHDWQDQVTLFGGNGRRILMCRGTRLSDGEADLGGYLIVFEDVTTLIQAQKDAAWSEMARRLAHEIKNPLTPIQLSAERLRHRYLPTFPDKEAETLDRMTHTIIQQVEAMKEMVNAFSDYAKAPQSNLKPLQLNQLIMEVLELYRCDTYRLKTELSPQVPVIQADSARLRQLLHNILKNALEASPEKPVIEVTTEVRQEATFSCIELRIKDNGPGVPEERLESIFDPYVTTKAKGTGLGLAIVKKIVEEHSGVIWAERDNGTQIVIRLPLSETQLEHSSPGVIIPPLNGFNG